MSLRTGRGSAAVPQSLDLTLPLDVTQEFTGQAVVAPAAGVPGVGLRLVG